MLRDHRSVRWGRRGKSQLRAATADDLPDVLPLDNGAGVQHAPELHRRARRLHRSVRQHPRAQPIAARLVELDPLAHQAGDRSGRCSRHRREEAHRARAFVRNGSTAGSVPTTATDARPSPATAVRPVPARLAAFATTAAKHIRRAVVVGRRPRAARDPDAARPGQGLARVGGGDGSTWTAIAVVCLEVGGCRPPRRVRSEFPSGPNVLRGLLAVRASSPL